ncbi:unnamed protein product [Schistosoma margrebowiei]|uniref:Uncharacterized protein n=1 Tax=Schistosoma margrebowiei TaxID=48269 RepID=A0A183MHG1_9TREM|nr:unnamed protein product [Schistosoma margrebowiei]
MHRSRKLRNFRKQFRILKRKTYLSVCHKHDVFLRIKNDVIYCRICLGSSDFEELISPCYCAGTIGIVHQRCLEKWLNLSRSKTCEICGFTFEVLKHYPHFCKVCFLSNYFDEFSLTMWWFCLKNAESINYITAVINEHSAMHLLKLTFTDRPSRYCSRYG